MALNKIINIIYNDSKFSVDTATYLKKRLISLNYHVSDTFDYTAELTICIGGDGSFLKVLHDYGFPDIPIIGINTGHLGFFTEVDPDQIDEFLDQYVAQEYTIDEINPIEAIICTRNSCIEAMGLNEIVIKGDKSRTIHLDIYVDNHLIQRFSGDGILISTSTGSTAYNYSSGGSIVDPRIDVLQVTPLAPINTNAYRSFTSSVILPADAVIKVSPEYRFENSIVIVSDGVEHHHDAIIEVVLELSELKVKMLRLKNSEFWKKVIEKFL
ncbi:NAD(+) kinase [Alkaliphilus metalliredigens QYMF]|uniref:NAD kinase n=1 Tax=Alkaliphilus metalliredigens (strain QYMF) TaxID=293826 RepID=A6TSZ5_ALKMQ|nr:NAD(+)/NADH kinase [Alkaliphilus metalliredigens]ABR49313.1 NAD(+) kinase [Alkaliphilus metalliredigens QYMF]